MSSFHLTTASVLGREHARLFRNNQDGVAGRVEAGVAVAVVTDGCGSGSSSEVGARLGARFLAQRLPGLAREFGVGPTLAERAAEALLEWIGQVVRPLDVDGSGLASLVGEQWLFTVLCAVMDERSALIFGIGDGVWSADGAGRVLEPGEDNAPDYLAYRLVPEAVRGKVGVPVVHFCGQARELAIATDGLARASLDCSRDERSGLPAERTERPESSHRAESPHGAESHPRSSREQSRDGAFLAALGADALVWRNPVALQRKLQVLSAREKALHDDTTVALLKRSA